MCCQKKIGAVFDDERECVEHNLCVRTNIQHWEYASLEDDSRGIAVECNVGEKVRNKRAGKDDVELMWRHVGDVFQERVKGFHGRSERRPDKSFDVRAKIRCHLRSIVRFDVQLLLFRARFWCEKKCWG